MLTSQSCSRPALQSDSADLGKEGAAVAAFAPQWPEPREERWFFFVADPGTNEVISPVEHVSLVEAEFLSADAAQVICATGFQVCHAPSCPPTTSLPRDNSLCLCTAARLHRVAHMDVPLVLHRQPSGQRREAAQPVPAMLGRSGRTQRRQQLAVRWGALTLS